MVGGFSFLGHVWLRLFFSNGNGFGVFWFVIAFLDLHSAFQMFATARACHMLLLHATAVPAQPKLCN